MSTYLAEVERYYLDAEDEFKLEHYHLVVGNLMYALHILEEHHDQEHELAGKISHLLGRAHLRLKHFEKAHEVLERAICFYEDRDPVMVAEIFNLQGLLFSESGKDRKAVTVYAKNIQHIAQYDSPNVAKIRHVAFYNLANCYLRMGEFDRACENYRKLFKLLRNSDNNSLRGKVLMGVGYILHLQGQLASAGRCYKLAKHLIDPVADPIAYGRVAHNLGEIYLAKGSLSKTRELFEESVKQAQLYKMDKLRVASSLSGIAYTYLDSDLEKLKTYSLEALTLTMSGNGNRFSAGEEQELGRAFLLFCHFLYHEGKWEDCKLYLTQAERILTKYKMTFELNQLNQFKDRYLTKEVKT